MFGRKKGQGGGGNPCPTEKKGEERESNIIYISYEYGGPKKKSGVAIPSPPRFNFSNLIKKFPRRESNPVLSGESAVS